MIDHDESMNRKEKWEQCSQKAKPFLEIFRKAGLENDFEPAEKRKLLAYLAKPWFRCHICLKHFEENQAGDQKIMKHIEEEWCHYKCRNTKRTARHPSKKDNKNFSRKYGIDLQIWRQQQRGFDTSGGYYS